MRKMMKKDCFEIAVHSNIKNSHIIKEQINKMTSGMENKIQFYGDESSIIPEDEEDPWAMKYVREFCQVPSHVNYVSESFSIPSFLAKDSSKLHILSEILSNGHLHNLIREKGGAYGAYSMTDP